MKSKSKNDSSIRVFGQRSITSTFRSLPSNPTFHHSQHQTSRKTQNTHLSLSNFLDRKLQKSSPIHQTVPGKSTPFQSPLGLSIPTGTGEQAGTVKQVEEERNSGSDKLIFERFKHTDEEKGDFVSPLGVDELENSVADDIEESRKRNGVDELENSVADDIEESRKRKNPFEGRNEDQTVRKHVVVLGGESKLKKKGQTENDYISKKPRPLYNHYANGRGWWDHDMEGVDNEELGFTEVWEGVGSTTLGGIVDWH